VFEFGDGDPRHFPAGDLFQLHGGNPAMCGRFQVNGCLGIDRVCHGVWGQVDRRRKKNEISFFVFSLFRSSSLPEVLAAKKARLGSLELALSLTGHWAIILTHVLCCYLS
jgi:hypothetical protein